MDINVEATCQDGVLKPSRPLTLPEGMEVRVTISLLDEDYDPLDAVIGICKEGPDISLAERHDEILYGLMEGKEREP
jgi:predicted DNA-binding antitoxin AbrB/MazE fold protein